MKDHVLYLLGHKKTAACTHEHYTYVPTIMPVITLQHDIFDCTNFSHELEKTYPSTSRFLPFNCLVTNKAHNHWLHTWAHCKVHVILHEQDVSL